MASFDRLRKAVTHQKETLTELDNKALVLLKRRQEREAAGAEYLKKLQMYKDKLEIEKLQQELIKRKKKKKANDDPEGRKEQNTAFLSVDQIVQENIRKEDEVFSALSKLAGPQRKEESFPAFVSPFID